MAEVYEAFVRGEGGFVVAVDAAAVVYSAVGGFDHPSSRLDDKPVAGLGPDTTSTLTPALLAAAATVWSV
ncbi:hypothetical protein [Mycobacterium sp.]|uniref:hypothetical protein n=1 Tax=Mycobacterium sp. TaxID=1785 RepID=UPI003D6C6496